MNKRILSLFITFLFLCGTSSAAFAVDNPQDVIEKGKIKFQQMNESIMETNNQISVLNTEMDKMKNEINKNNADISSNTKIIEAEKTNMEKLVEEVNITQQSANKRLKAMYINGYNENFLAVLLSSENFSDFLYKYESIKNVVSFDKKLLNELAAKRKSLNEAIDKLNLKLQQLQELKNSNTEKLKQLNESKQKLQELVKQFDQEKANAAQLIKENEEKLIAHAISVIDSNSSTISNMKSALQTLNSLLNQLSTSSVKQKAKAYIETGNIKLADMIAKETKPEVVENDTYKATYTMTATAYAGGTLTAMGLKPVRDPDGLSTIAVDPKVIPLGTKVYIPGYGYAICSDTGGKIKGNIIDLYMNSVAECIQWGRRPVTLHVIAYPGEW